VFGFLLQSLAWILLPQTPSWQDLPALFFASRAEMNNLEINKKLCFQLEETKQQLRDLKEKFLISEATVYSWPTSCGNTVSFVVSQSPK
jgi:hypothetical protein